MMSDAVDLVCAPLGEGTRSDGGGDGGFWVWLSGFDFRLGRGGAPVSMPPS